MLCDPSEGEVVETFALVTYIHDPLRKFLDDLRRELVPGCAPHAHVTILPPRPLSGTPSEAIEIIRTRLPDLSPFEIKAGEVLVFPVSDVVYVSIKAGNNELFQMHRALNKGVLEFRALFPYHPHITLAQNLTHERSIELAEIAAQRWSEYTGPRAFPVESLVFVQNTTQNSWVDLAHFQLEPTPSIRR